MTTRLYRTDVMWLLREADNGKPLAIPAFRMGMVVDGANLMNNTPTYFLLEYQLQPLYDGSFNIATHTVTTDLDEKRMIEALQAFEQTDDTRLPVSLARPLSDEHAAALAKNTNYGNPHFNIHPICVEQRALLEKQASLRTLGTKLKLRGPK